MNGIHDMGGMHGMGTLQYESGEPVYHTEWESRVDAMTAAMRATGVIPGLRRGIEENISAADYLRMSYYERWLTQNIELLVKHGLVTREEINSGRPAAGSTKATPPLLMSEAEATLRPGSYMRPEANAKARFKPGQRVRARNMHPPGHTRLPRYARGKVGTVVQIHGIFVFPDMNAQFLGEQAQYLYSIRFAAQELWGERASPRDFVYIDMWDSYLEHV